MKPHPVCRATYTLYIRHHSYYLCPHTHCMDNITPTLCMTSHSPCVWHRLHQTRHHILNLCIYDIALTICLTSVTLYKVSHPQFMTSPHIIYDITGTVFMISLPQYLTLHQQYLYPHNPSTYDLWTTVCITSHPLYIWHLCTIHNVTSTLWVHIIVVTT